MRIWLGMGLMVGNGFVGCPHVHTKGIATFSPSPPCHEPEYVLCDPPPCFQPPAFMMLTPSGRFETNMKICLSISTHHPEHWQPSWSVRTALTALIAFLPTPGAGALGSLVGSKIFGKIPTLLSHATPYAKEEAVYSFCGVPTFVHVFYVP